MKVLISGGLGFVGSAICHAWQEQNDTNLVILDNESKGTFKNIEGVDYHYLLEFRDG